MADSPSDLLASIYDAGTALLAALDAGQYADAQACAAERGVLVERLRALGTPPDGAHAALAARLTAQHRALAEQMEAARARLADALRHTDRLHRANDAYAAPAAARTRLHATG